MNEYKEVPVEVAKQIAGAYGKDIVVINCYSREHNLLHSTTYGITPADKVSAAKAGEIIAEALGSDVSRLTEYEDFRKDLDAGKQRAMEEAIKKHLPDMDPEMAADFRKAIGE